MRLKAVSNIQKIAKSMKMVAAAKYAKAERELRAARPFQEGAISVDEKLGAQQKEGAQDHLVVALASVVVCTQTSPNLSGIPSEWETSKIKTSNLFVWETKQRLCSPGCFPKRC